MDRAKVATECVRIERRGGSVREYLAGLGCISPWGTWHRLQVEELGRKPHEITDGKANKRKRIGYDAELEEWTMGKTIITPEDRLEAVKIALEGGSPLTYLEGLGITRASVAWAHIKKRLKEDDPDMFAKLPKRLTSRGGVFGKKNPETPETPKELSNRELQEIANDALLSVASAAGYELVGYEQVEKKDKPEEEKPAITKPLMFDGLACREVEGKFGRYRYNCSRGVEYIDMENKDGLDVMSLTKDEWREFFDEVKRAGLVLGVEL